MNDIELLAAVPDSISIGQVLKATPVAEGGRRILYFQASNERLDQQHEQVAAKALEAGYGSHSATLASGGAPREQSLQGAPINYFDFRNKLAAAIKNGEVGGKPSAASLVDLVRGRFRYSCDQASESVEWFMRDLQSRR